MGVKRYVCDNSDFSSLPLWNDTSCRPLSWQVCTVCTDCRQANVYPPPPCLGYAKVTNEYSPYAYGGLDEAVDARVQKGNAELVQQRGL